MKKAVLIKANRSDLFSNDIEDDSYAIIRMYQSYGKIVRSIRFLLYRFRISIPSFFYNRELRDLDADLFVVQDADTQICFLKWLKKQHPGKRIILWYWNTVEEQRRYLDPCCVPTEIEKWSYSRFDCERYGMSYNTSFYPYRIDAAKRATTPQRDVFFIGKDKGRMGRLLDLKKQLDGYGLSTDFYICPTNLRDRLKPYYSKNLPYNVVVDDIVNNRAIVDCAVSDNAGPTIRPLEALFWRRKLITDDKSIIDEDYYDPRNVFVIGVDDMDSIVDFVRGEYNVNDYEGKYTMGAWMKRFYERHTDI